MTVQKPSDLIRFISNIPTMSDGTVARNTLDSVPLYASPMYTPTFSLSAIARITQDILNSDKIELVNVPLDPRTIVALALKSDLASYSPDIYLLLRMVVLESFALLYHIEQEEESVNLQYVSVKDINRVRENINYISDYMGTEEKYYHIIEILRHMHISFGYLQHQIDVIMSSRGVR